MKLETITDNLRNGYKQLVPETFQHVDQLMKARLTNPELRALRFYTADGEQYDLTKTQEPRWAITRQPNNLVLRHIDEAYKQLISNGKYNLNPQEAETARKAESTLTVKMSDMGLKKEDDEFSFLPIKTNGYDKLAPLELRVAQRIYGKGKDFAKVMKMLSDARIKETRIWVLSPDYVREYASAGPISRASWLDFLDGDSRFVAGSRVVVVHDCLRGVRRERAVPEGDALKNTAVPSAPSEIKPEISLSVCYQALLADADKAVQALDDKTAGGLLRIVADYFTGKVQ